MIWSSTVGRESGSGNLTGGYLPCGAQLTGQAASEAPQELERFFLSSLE